MNPHKCNRNHIVPESFIIRQNYNQSTHQPILSIIFIIIIIINKSSSTSPINRQSSSLLADANNTAGRTSASVTSLLALLVLALAKVVGAGVHDDGAAQHALRADQLDELVRDGALGVALGVGLEVAQVTNVALAVRGGAVGLVVRVDWWEVVSRGTGGECFVVP